MHRQSETPNIHSFSIAIVRMARNSKAIISHRCVDASKYEYASMELDRSLCHRCENLPRPLFPIIPLTILLRHTSMPENGLPPCSAFTKYLSALNLCSLRQHSSTPSFYILLRSLQVEDEDMEPIQGCDQGQLAYRLHSIWRACCSVPDCKTT